MAEDKDSKLCIGILTVSDRCAAGEATDISGEKLSSLIEHGIIPNAEVVASGCVADDQSMISEVLQQWADERNLHVIFTTGGTGLSARDVTPEAVKQVIHREVNGLCMLMTSLSLRVTPLAALSRPVCGVRSRTLIITLPGSAKAAQECLSFLAPVIPHAVDLIIGKVASVCETHRVLHATGVKTFTDDMDGAQPMGGFSACHGHGHQHNHHHHGHHQFHNQHFHPCNNRTSCGHATETQKQSNADVSKVSRRPRKSPYPMISVDQAQEIIMSMALAKEPVQIPTSQAAGFVLAVDITSGSALPPFNASIKDGYAVLSQDGDGLRTVVGGVSAGDKVAADDTSLLTPGTCVRINTGAPLPAGADAVVQVEDTELTKSTEDGCEELEIKILSLPFVGKDIRPIGCDIEKGQLVLRQGTYMGPAEIGVACSVGVYNITVYPKPLVGLLSTGNELQAVESGPLRSGHIYDSNQPSLQALLQLHHIPSMGGGVVRDTPAQLLGGLTGLLDRGVDLIVTTGGVSMGDKDILRAVLEADFEATVHFAQVFMKPGKPTTFASFSYGGRMRLLLGLPGNPVSATVTATLYLLPLCRRLAGREDYMYKVIQAKLKHPITLDPRPEYHRATLSFAEAQPVAASTGNQLSSRLLSFDRAAALLVLPPRTEDRDTLARDSTVQAILLQ